MKAKLLPPEEVRRWTKVPALSPIASLVFEYACAVAVTLAILASWHHHIHTDSHWGIPLGVTFPGLGAIGCIQHRIALLGHEGSHHLLHPDRRLNDLIAELLCFFPLFGTLSQYRAKHLSHHLHPNDPEHDSNLAGDRAKRLYARFPMPRPSFVWHYFLKFLWPPFVLANLRDLFQVVTIGSGLSPLPENTNGNDRNRITATHLGVGYLILLGAIQHYFRASGPATVAIATGIPFAAALLVWWILPDHRFRDPGARTSISPRTTGLLRFAWFTLLFGGLAMIRATTGINAPACFFILWIIPLVYVFPYLMLLREIYQHANADQGELTNSRIIRADPFTHWALLGYGNDAHLVHHIYPNIPHRHLDAVHRALFDSSEDYRRSVRVTNGTFRTGDRGQLSLLDDLAVSGDRDAIPARPPRQSR